MRRPWRPGRGRAGARPWGGSAWDLLSMVVAGAADVLVQHSRRITASSLLLLSILQDRRHRAVGAGAKRQGPGARAVQPLGAVSLAEPEDADAGPEPLLGMRARAQDHLEQRGCIVADGGGLAQDPLVCPIAVAPVRTRHVFGQRRRPMRPQV